MTETPMLVHVITLALGLIIAFGLQQIVAHFQRRRRERQVEKEIAAQTQESALPEQTPHE